MTKLEQIDVYRSRGAGRSAEYSIEYLDAKKEAARKERRSARNWVRMLYYLPYMAAMIITPKLHIMWPYKFCIDVVCFGFSIIIYGRAFDRAVMHRLNAELRARAD